MKTEKEIIEKMKSYEKDILKYEKEGDDAVATSLKYMREELVWVLNKQ